MTRVAPKSQRALSRKTTTDGQRSYWPPGTAVYFQTVRSATHGVSTVTLDGSDFRFDSGTQDGDPGAGTVWAAGEGFEREMSFCGSFPTPYTETYLSTVLFRAVGLKNAQHTLTVTQTATTGVELSVNAFVYVIVPGLWTISQTSHHLTVG